MNVIIFLLRFFALFWAGIFGVIVLVYFQSFIIPPLDPETKEAVTDLLILGGVHLWKLSCLELAFYHDFFNKIKGRGIFLLAFIALAYSSAGYTNFLEHTVQFLAVVLLYGLAWLLHR